ncbi:hypothetical protein K461DRAFT_290101 [Myriangium duriaei CBS 260.36]|uniref:Transcription factor IIIC putative zinc-finger domain-containing protein n=1 Tax=Myriangium duriaei CBS 260.36 TaxID=1168546 RepID=A0A9P4MSS5_9PEZI|nr:hypothetical protein K461DRAFT_290101 [Myriangium duriaei CBS 260.36]
MAESIILGGWPAAADCVAWSYDNVIAVAIRDSVTLLTPSFSLKPGAGLEWKTATLDVGRYTETEVPLRQTLPWSSFSIGEELSERQVTVLAWSPPRLGMFGRSVLAVLTADDILSIWECHGKLDAKHHWRRALMVNDALKSHHTRNASNADKGHDNDSASHRLVRVKSFSWAQLPETHDQTMRLESVLSEASHFMAVSDDNGGIAVLQLRSPHDLMHPNGDHWSCDVVSYFIAATIEDTSITRCLPATFFPPPTIATQLSWSPWVIDSTHNVTSTLAYTIDSILHLRAIQATAGSEGWRLITSELSTDGEPLLKGTARSPLRWVSKATHLSTNQLLILDPENLLRVTLVYSTPQSFTVEPLVFAVNSWAQVTGMAVAVKESSDINLTLTCYSADLGSSAYNVCIAPGGDVSIITPPWKKRLQEAMQEFGVRHNLSDFVSPKIHGVACSPLEDFTVTCTTLHPSDGPEYTILARQETIVTIAKQMDAKGPFRTALQQGFSLPGQIIADSIMPSLVAATRFEHRADDEDDLTMVQDVIRYLALDNFPDESIDLTRHVVSLERAIHNLRLRVLLNREAIQRRAEMLVKIARGGSEMPPTPDLIVIKVLASAVYNVPAVYHEGHTVSGMIYKIHTTILRIIVNREQGGQKTPEDPQEQRHEVCNTCGSKITFESLRWSRCEQGHQFSRCGLTFLSIQAPGISKHCRICSTRFLNEYKRASLQVSNDGLDPRLAVDQSEPLLQALFAACNVCVYCGGSFIT